jgi:hypothetical protein
MGNWSSEKMTLEEAALSLIQLFLGTASLYALLTQGIMIALMFMFSLYLVGFIKSIIKNKRASGHRAYAGHL